MGRVGWGELGEELADVGNPLTGVGGFQAGNSCPLGHISLGSLIVLPTRRPGALVGPGLGVGGPSDRTSVSTIV